MANTIFITYNHASQAEESTALRLQTISNLYGLSVVLPYRHRNLLELSTETKNRINKSTFVVAFCADGLTESLKDEIDFALSENKPIVVIYDHLKGKKINLKTDRNIKEVFVDFNKTDEALHNIADFLRSKISTENSKKDIKKPGENSSGIGIALLGIGLGLLAAWTLSKNTK